MLMCPECKSAKLKKYGIKWSRVDGKRQKTQQYQCNDCGKITIHPRILNLPERDDKGRFTRVALQKPSENENNKAEK